MKDDTVKSNTTPPFLYQETAEEEFLATIENIGGDFWPAMQSGELSTRTPQQ